MRRTKLFLTTLVMSMMLSSTVLAGSWQSNSTGWWYQNDDGTFPVNTWQWIDGNNDGIAEKYYFDGNGYCLMNSTTPDGQTVDSNGALVINGIVQTQSLQTQVGAKQDAPAETNAPVTNTVWIPATGEKYHSIPNCGRMNPSKATQLSLSDALARGYTQCSKCY